MRSHKTRFNYVVYVELPRAVTSVNQKRRGRDRAQEQLETIAKVKSVGTTYHGGQTRFIRDATSIRLYWGFSTKEKAEKIRDKFKNTGYVAKLISGKRAPCTAYGVLPLYLPKPCASVTPRDAAKKGRWSNENPKN